ncbi:hypothetical protein LCGC14_1412600, partial [marine sediment metagenome]
MHILAALTLFGIVRRTLSGRRLRERFGKAATPLAAIVAVIWLVHPLQTGSVTYVIQRCESLMGMLYLMSLYCVIRGLPSQRPVRWHAAAVCCAALSMGAKEVAVTLPVVVLLYDRTFAAGTFKAALRQRWKLYVALAATWGILAWLVVRGRAEGGFADRVQQGRMWEYAGSQFGVILHYLKLSLWPRILCMDYFWPAARTVGQILPHAVVVLGLFAASVWALWRRRVLGFAGVCFFLILAPTSSIMPIIDRAFEHRMYLSLACVVVVLVLGAYALGGRLLRVAFSADRPRRVGVVLGALLSVAVVSALGARSIVRNADYRSELRMWRKGLRDRRDNPRIRNSLAVALLERGSSHREEGNGHRAAGRADLATQSWNSARKDIAEAEGYLREAIVLLPSYPNPHINLGMILLGRGELDQAERSVATALASDKRYSSLYAYATAHGAMGEILEHQGRLEEAAGYYATVLRIQKY